MDNNINILKNKLKESDIGFLENEPMKNHTTFGIGGPIDVLILPKKNSQIQKILQLINRYEIKLYYFGSGSNILINDIGLSGAGLSLKKSSKKIIFNKSTVYVDCGAMLGTFVKEVSKRNYCGFESLIGVPGTIGGALIMNAGAYGSEISNNLISVNTIKLDGKVQTYLQNDIDFSYRSSSFPKNEILLNAIFNCKKGNESLIKKNKANASQSRKNNQPLKFRSAGSIFKNPRKDLPAGLLIDKAGLKGKSIGGAMVSDKHANFIVNINSAKFSDVMELINISKKKVFDKFNIKLDLEIKIYND